MKPEKRKVLSTIMRMFHRAASEAEFADERPKRPFAEAPPVKFKIRRPSQASNDKLLDDIASGVVTEKGE